MCCTWQVLVVECKEHHHILAYNHQKFLPGLAQHDPTGTQFYLQLIDRPNSACIMVFYRLLLALLGSYLATWQVGCTESSYFYSTRVVGSITWTLLE